MTPDSTTAETIWRNALERSLQPRSDLENQYGVLNLIIISQEYRFCSLSFLASLLEAVRQLASFMYENNNGPLQRKNLQIGSLLDK